MHHNDTIAVVATDDYDVEADAGELHALQAEARWAIRRQHAAEAVRRLRIRRHGVAVVVQASVGDDVTDVDCPDLVDDHAVMEERVKWMTDATPELSDSTLIARPRLMEPDSQ